MKALCFVVLGLLALAAHGAPRSEKRVVGSLRPLLVAGGGIIKRNSERIRQLQTGDEESRGTLLLETDGEEAGPENFAVLQEAKYSSCFAPDPKGQGRCNSCWAFAVQKMMQTRLCKFRADSGEEEALMQLSPYNLICHLQMGDDVCEPQDIASALEYALKPGILRRQFVTRWEDVAKRSWNHAQKKNMLNRVVREKGWLDSAKAVADVSDPTREKCRKLMYTDAYKSSLVPAPKIAVSSPPHTAGDLRRRLAFGPVVAIMRLSWDFLTFEGSLFNPSEKLIFCRKFRATDTDDFCDPAREKDWDEEQRLQQVRVKPDGISQDDWEDTWYNHFVTLHGWGKTKDDVRYWIIENSWSSIYANSVELDNNGVGIGYSTFKSTVGKNHFVLIASSVAGSGGLEMINRPVFFVSYPKVETVKSQ